MSYIYHLQLVHENLSTCIAFRFRTFAQGSRGHIVVSQSLLCLLVKIFFVIHISKFEFDLLSFEDDLAGRILKTVNWEKSRFLMGNFNMKIESYSISMSHTQSE